MNWFKHKPKQEEAPAEQPEQQPALLSFEETEALKVEIVKRLKTVFDPEIPVNIYDLGMIYRFDVSPDGCLDMDMTLTAPNCPAADFIMQDVRDKVGSLKGVNKVDLKLVFEPEWNKDMMSDEAKLELGFL